MISQSVVVDESASVSVINSVGQTVYCSMLNFVGGSSPLNIANVPAGVYIIVLSDDHSAKQSFRMVIEK